MTTPNDSRDFYPTPDNLAWEMAYSLQSTEYGWKHLPQPILEPSAGDGALARQIHAVADIRHDPKTGELDRYSTSKAKEFDLDCVELSSDFRAKLKKDGFRVVHDDFLTFRPAKKYAAIIMNPPFSAGAAHFPDMPASSTIYYFIYCKGPGDQHFTLCDPWGGRRGMNKVFAPRFTKDQADKVVAQMTERNPGFTFQRRPAR